MFNGLSSLDHVGLCPFSMICLLQLLMFANLFQARYRLIMKTLIKGLIACSCFLLHLFTFFVLSGFCLVSICFIICFLTNIYLSSFYAAICHLVIFCPSGFSTVNCYQVNFYFARLCASSLYPSSFSDYFYPTGFYPGRICPSTGLATKFSPFYAFYTDEDFSHALCHLITGAKPILEHFHAQHKCCEQFLALRTLIKSKKK